MAMQRWSRQFSQQHGGYISSQDVVARYGFANLAVANGEVNGDHSTTNTQVAGIDEADLVETDGSYVYTLAGRELLIADVRNLSPRDSSPHSSCRKRARKCT